MSERENRLSGWREERENRGGCGGDTRIWSGFGRGVKRLYMVEGRRQGLRGKEEKKWRR